MCCIVLLYTAVAAFADRLFGVLRQELHAYARLSVFKLLTDMFSKVITLASSMPANCVHCSALGINLQINLFKYIHIRRILLSMKTTCSLTLPVLH